MFVESRYSEPRWSFPKTLFVPKALRRLAHRTRNLRTLKRDSSSFRRLSVDEQVEGERLDSIPIYTDAGLYGRHIDRTESACRISR